MELHSILKKIFEQAGIENPVQPPDAGQWQAFLHHLNTECIEIERERSLFRSLFDALPVYLYAKDRQHRFLISNTSHAQSLGHLIDQIIGKTDFDFYPVEIAEKFYEVEEIVLQQGEALINLQESAADQDGQEIWHESTKIPLYDTQGNITGLAGITYDITERMRVLDAEKAQRLLSDALRDTAAALNSTLNFDEVLDRILVNIKQVIPHDTADIMLIEGGIGRIARYRDYTQGKLEASVLDLRFPIQETATFRQMFSTGQPLIIPDVAHYSEWQTPVEPLWIHSYAGLPIQLDGEVIGFLNLNSTTPNFFSPDLIVPLQAFSNQIATAVQNARLYEKARELARAEERQRLAQDLHDGVNQTIFATTVIAGSLPYLWEKDPEAVKKSLNDILRLTRSSQAGMRILLFELRPETLVRTTLATLLEHLAATLRGKLDGTVEINIDFNELLKPDIQTVFYRIAQESLTNILKHSRANQVEVSLKREHDYITLRISDNGRGFDMARVAPDRFGLKIMRERAEGVGARFEIQSERGQGTSLTVTAQVA